MSISESVLEYAHTLKIQFSNVMTKASCDLHPRMTSNLTRSVDRGQPRLPEADRPGGGR
eukprot:m.171082 g.171082  ORF g.171082 m.171082 type:complete len:59 (-) comp14806_c0_seq2:2210-2386(-)